MGQPQAQQPFVKKRPEARPGNVCVKTQYVASIGHPAAATPARLIFPAVGLEITDVQYMDANRGLSSCKHSL